MKYLKQLALAGLIALPINAQSIETIEEPGLYGKAHLSVGTSSNERNPFHGEIGASFLKKTDQDFSVGINVNQLIENNCSELSTGIELEKGLNNYSLGTIFGLSRVNLDNPLQTSGGEVNEPLPETSTFIRAYLTRKLTENLRLNASYQRNFGNQDLFDTGYPEHRISTGLEYSFNLII